MLRVCEPGVVLVGERKGVYYSCVEVHWYSRQAARGRNCRSEPRGKVTNGTPWGAGKGEVGKYQPRNGLGLREKRGSRPVPLIESEVSVCKRQLTTHGSTDRKTWQSISQSHVA